MFEERKVCYTALFTNLVWWHTGAVSFPQSDVILAQLACPLSDIMFCLHSRITNLSLYKHGYLLSPRLPYVELLEIAKKCVHGYIHKFSCDNLTTIIWAEVLNHRTYQDGFFYLIIISEMVFIILMNRISIKHLRRLFN